MPTPDDLERFFEEAGLSGLQITRRSREHGSKWVVIATRPGHWLHTHAVAAQKGLVVAPEPHENLDVVLGDILTRHPQKQKPTPKPKPTSKVKPEPAPEQPKTEQPVFNTDDFL